MTAHQTAQGAGASAHPLEREARELMTPGVVTIVEDATLAQVYRALHAHGVHALLVVGRHGGRPLGWVTATEKRVSPGCGAPRPVLPSQ